MRKRLRAAGTTQMNHCVIELPAARFEDAATELGSQGILRGVGDFVEAYGVDSVGREQIADTLAAALVAAAVHAAPRDDARIAVTADVMPGDVQLVLRLCPGNQVTDDACVGGFELWVSFPRLIGDPDRCPSA
jgi:hypothetical protein